MVDPSKLGEQGRLSDASGNETHEAPKMDSTAGHHKENNRLNTGKDDGNNQAISRDDPNRAEKAIDRNRRKDEERAAKRGIASQIGNTLTHNQADTTDPHAHDSDDDDDRRRNMMANPMFKHALKQLIHHIIAMVTKIAFSIALWEGIVKAVRWIWNGVKHLVHNIIKGAKHLWHNFENWAAHNKVMAATVKAVHGAWVHAGWVGKTLMVLGAVSTGGVGVISGANAINSYIQEQHQPARIDSSCGLLSQMAKSVNNATEDMAATGGASGSWKDNGKKIFDHLAKTDGFSGAGAAGAAGNAAQESQCNPTAYNPGGNVIGIFQWGNGGVNGDRFEKGGFCKNDDKSTWTIDNEMKLTDYELDHGYHGCKEKVGHETDPKEAAHIWAGSAPDGFEGAAGQNEGARENYAQQAYDAFNGSSISANDSLLGASAGDDATSNDGTATNAAAAKCTGNGAGGSDSADGTGSIKESSPSGTLRWHRDNVPDDVKPYIHDPQKAGLSWGSAKGWSTPGGQCVDLSVSLFHAIWKGAPGHLSGNGRDMANSAAAAFHGSTSKTPHAGAIVSQVGGGADPQYGHTYIVEHVLANGDIICVEQNVAGYSGDSNGTPETWDYLWISKDYYSKYDTFFTPNGSPNWNGA